jgi:hypothetical protein
MTRTISVLHGHLKIRPGKLWKTMPELAGHSVARLLVVNGDGFQAGSKAAFARQPNLQQEGRMRRVKGQDVMSASMKDIARLENWKALGWFGRGVAVSWLATACASRGLQSLEQIGATR